MDGLIITITIIQIIIYLHNFVWDTHSQTVFFLLLFFTTIWIVLALMCWFQYDVTPSMCSLLPTVTGSDVHIAEHILGELVSAFAFCRMHSGKLKTGKSSYRSPLYIPPALWLRIPGCCAKQNVTEDRALEQSTQWLTCQVCSGDFYQPLIEAFDRILSCSNNSMKPDQQHPVTMLFEAFHTWSFIHKHIVSYSLMLQSLLTEYVKGTSGNDKKESAVFTRTSSPVHCCSIARMCSAVKPQCCARIFHSPRQRCLVARSHRTERRCCVSGWWSCLKLRVLPTQESCSLGRFYIKQWGNSIPFLLFSKRWPDSRQSTCHLAQHHEITVTVGALKIKPDLTSRFFTTHRDTHSRLFVKAIGFDDHVDQDDVVSSGCHLQTCFCLLCSSGSPKYYYC